MEEEYVEMEETVINRLSVLNSIKLLAPEIQNWIIEEYNDYESFVESLERKCLRSGGCHRRSKKLKDFLDA